MIFLFAIYILLNPFDHSSVINCPSFVFTPSGNCSIMPDRYQVPGKLFHYIHQVYHFVPRSFKIILAMFFKTDFQETDRKYLQVGGLLILKVIPFKGPARTRPETRLFGEAHGIIFFDPSSQQTLVSTRKFHAKIMLATTEHRLIGQSIQRSKFTFYSIWIGR